MTNLTIVGAQWGDEGKGKIVDYFSNKFDVVLRFQGGHNAGHTIVINDTKFILSILPSGVIRNKLCIIGSGTVIDPIHLFKEIDYLKRKKIIVNNQNLKIANNASLLLPFHSLIDKIRENILSKEKIGTTRRGIGPCYEDKIARRGIKICDLENINFLKKRLKNLIDFHNIFLKNFSKTPISFNETFQFLKSVKKKLLSYSIDLSDFVNSNQFLNKKLLFEGAQGLMLDVDYGTFPYVTSNNTLPATASSSIGLNPKRLGNILGVVKAYTTRVGEGPFPTEIKSNLGLNLAKNGNEFGTVTGRQRRCGWFDSVQCKKAVNIAGIESLVLTKIDVLDSFKKINICYQYKLKNKLFNSMPNSISILNKIKPQYLSIKGWQCKTSGITNIKKLPKQAKKFIKIIEKLVGVPIILVSNGPDRKNIIKLKRF